MSDIDKILVMGAILGVAAYAVNKGISFGYKIGYNFGLKDGMKKEREVKEFYKR